MLTRSNHGQTRARSEQAQAHSWRKEPARIVSMDVPSGAFQEPLETGFGTRCSWSPAMSGPPQPRAASSSLAYGAMGGNRLGGQTGLVESWVPPETEKVDGILAKYQVGDRLVDSQVGEVVYPTVGRD